MKMEAKRKDIDKLIEKEKTLNANFVQSLGDNNKFAEYLMKVFKKRIKRSKKKSSDNEGERPTWKNYNSLLIIHNHNTRNNNLNFKVRYRRTTKKALIICVKGTQNMWNSLSPDIKLSRNVNAFKKMLKSSLLENYKFWKSEQFLILQFIEFVLHMIYVISLKRYN